MRNFFPIVSAIALFAPLAGQAAVAINFDPDGASGAYGVSQIDLLDWAPGNALSVGGGGVTTGETNQLLYQANLAITSLGGVQQSTSCTAGTACLTAVAGFQQTASVSTAGTFTNVNFSLASNPVLSSTNFFYIYANSTQGNNLTGTGFTAGNIIFSGHVTQLDTGNFSTSGGVQQFDQFGANNYIGQNTIVGAGATDITVSIDFADQTYFPGLIAGNLAFSFFNSTQITPFRQADPSAAFSSNGLIDGDKATNLNPINGVTTPGVDNDFQFQADANQSFEVLVVPEPGSVALVGLALAGLGIVTSRRRN